MPSEKEKMLAGKFYIASDPQLLEERNQARALLHRLNTTEFGHNEKYPEIILKLLPNCAPDIWIEPPFYCDYGYNIFAGERVFFNYNCVILDVCTVRIGSNVMFGPSAHVYTADHPRDFRQRRQDLEFGEPVSIGDDCWIGGHAVILPGVHIGNRCIIGANVVVRRDVPDDTILKS